MPNSQAYIEAHRDEIAAYQRQYRLAHFKGQPRIPAIERQSKQCRKCGVVKPRSEYTVRLTGPRVGSMVSPCKKCSTEIVKGNYKVKHERDPTLYRRVEWPSKLKRLYGITVDDYHRMLAEQGGCCALCGADNPMDGNRNYKKRKRTVFDVDHCHRTKKVRGLLCTRCNRLVGLANDSAATARKLVEYLSKGV